MATSTLIQSSPMGSPAGSPRSCLYLSGQQTFHPKADWHASFAKINRESCIGPSPKPLILRQRNGIWLTSLSDIPTPTPTPIKDLSPQPQPQPKTPPTPPKTAGNNVTSRLCLGRVPKTLRCHVCQSIIKEQYFQNHLFFGTVRCNVCDVFCGDCRSFERLKADASKSYSSCQHSFSFNKDPYEYLVPRLSGSDDMDVGGSLTLPNKLRVLQHYVNQLTSLQLREPWCTAVRKCKGRLLKFHLEEIGVSKDSLNTDEDFLSVEKDAHGSAASLGESDKGDGSLKTTPKRHSCPSPALRESPEREDTEDGVLLTQNYDLEHLEQTVEYVELEASCRLQGQAGVQNKSKKRRKTDPYKNLKANRLTLPHRRKQSPMVPDYAEPEDEDEDESGLVMEEVSLPENGNYLMVRETMEDCPMCYEPLSLNDCSVNLRTFLFTMSCPECDLLIYVVPDLPDGLKIVTDGGNGEMITQSEQDKQAKSLRKVRGQDFFAK